MTSDWLPHLHLAAWREKANLTQEQMGNKLNLSKSAISRWEAGLRNMDLRDLARVASLLNVEPVALFLSPEDYDLAICIHRFSLFAKDIGAIRAKSLLDGMGAPKESSTPSSHK
jgi:transcriptional regulator with XRE-family HTH domain